MVEVIRNYKLINLNIGGQERQFEIDTKDAWNVAEVMSNNKVLTINEGDMIRFAVNNGTGELKEGLVQKLSGKEDKLKIQLQPKNSDCIEIWPVVAIQEDTIQVVEEEQ